MWSSDRRSLLAALCSAALLAGCGFTPVYAPGGVGERLDGQILPDDTSNRTRYAFVVRLEDRLGRNDSAPYRLSYDVRTSKDRLAITSDNDTLRYHLRGEVDYKVSDRASGKVLTKGRVQNFTSYSAIGTTVATRASETDAEERLMVILADQVVTQLIATAETWLP